MIVPIKMSRESRVMLNELELLSAKHNISAIYTNNDVYLCELLTAKYYTSPMLNLIKTRLKGMKNISFKNMTIQYWLPIIDKIFNTNNSVRRGESASSYIVYKDINDKVPKFVKISNYMITDYSTSDAEKIIYAVDTYSMNEIEYAINTAIKSGVYNIQYISVIMEKEKILNDMKIKKIKELGDRSKHIINDTKVNNSPLDMAMAQYQWQKAQEDAELERLMNELGGNL